MSVHSPALAIASTASSTTDQTSIKGCLTGSDGNYTVLENNTGRNLKITARNVDLKPHLGHDVTLIGHKVVPRAVPTLLIAALPLLN